MLNAKRLSRQEVQQLFPDDQPEAATQRQRKQADEVAVLADIERMKASPWWGELIVDRPEWTVATVLRALAKGNSRQGASQIAGLADSTMRLWLRTSPEFAAAVRRAEGTLKQRAAENIASMIERGDPKWSAWYLEHRFPTEFAALRSVEDAITWAEAQRLSDRLALEGIDKPPSQILIDLETMKRGDRKQRATAGRKPLPDPAQLIDTSI